MLKKGKQIVWRIMGVVGKILGLIIVILACLISFSVKWMLKTWTNLSMDELVYHITSPLEGTNHEIIQNYFNECITPIVLIFLFLIILLAWARSNRKNFRIIIGGSLGISILMLCSFTALAWNKLEIASYTSNQGIYSDFIDNNYVDPVSEEINFPEQKRNLIYIFAESMEVTYADRKNGGAFSFNCIPELTTLAGENENFSGDKSTILNGGHAMPGATWTAAAMYAQTSGLPLTASIGEDMETKDTSYAWTLGDVLEEAGYSQTLMMGSESNFGGKEDYFIEHGNYDIIDYNYAILNGWIPENYRVWWGYEDKRLFEFAKTKLYDLAQQDTPFNLTLLTVDTHFEDGYVCDECNREFGDNQYANIMNCASRQLTDFVKWIQQQDFYSNTTIVIVGDHPTMDSDFCENIDEEYSRKVYTCYINSAVGKALPERREYTTFDMFPTTLASLGATISGDRLGLGTNLFSDQQTLTERYGKVKEERELQRKSKLVENMAKKGSVPIVEAMITDINKEEGIITVGIPRIDEETYNVESVRIAVWVGDDKTNIQWIQLNRLEDGTYKGDINLANYGYAKGTYHIHTYMMHTSGKQYKLNETETVVE